MKKKMCFLFALCFLFSCFTGCNYVIGNPPNFHGVGRWMNEETGSWFEIKAEYEEYPMGEIIIDGKVYPVALSFWYNDVYFFPAEKRTKPEHIPEDVDGYPLYGVESLPYFGGKWRCTDTTFFVFKISVAYTGHVVPEDLDRLEDWILPEGVDRMKFVRQK